MEFQGQDWAQNCGQNLAEMNLITRLQQQRDMYSTGKIHINANLNCSSDSGPLMLQNLQDESIQGKW